MRSRHSTSLGFTLIEMMLTVVIIGIMASVAVFTIGGNERRELRNEANRLHMLLIMAADEAIFQGVDLGFQYDKSDRHYEIKQFENKDDQIGWRDFEAMKASADGKGIEYPEAFAPYTLPEHIQLELELDDDEERVSLTDLAKELKAAQMQAALDRGEEIDEPQEEEVEGTETQEPGLILDSSGEVTPFKLYLSLDISGEKGPTYIIESDGISAIALEMADDK